MIADLLSESTPDDVRMDSSVESTIRVPLSKRRTLARLLSFVIMIAGAIFALVNVALHFSDATVATKMYDNAMAVDAVRILQLLIASATLLFGVFSILRLLSLIQSPDAGITLGPRGLTLACDLRSAEPRRIAWQSIESIDASKPQGVLTFTIRLRPRDLVPDENRRFRFWPGARETIQTRALRIKHSDLKTLLDRYFARYADAKFSTLTSAGKNA